MGSKKGCLVRTAFFIEFIIRNDLIKILPVSPSSRLRAPRRGLEQTPIILKTPFKKTDALNLRTSARICGKKLGDMQVLALNLTPWPPLHEWKRGNYSSIKKPYRNLPTSRLTCSKKYNIHTAYER